MPLSFTIDRSNIFTKKLAKNLGFFAKGRAMKEIAKEVVEYSIILTPLDTGRAKAGWKRAADGLGAIYINHGTDGDRKSQGEGEGTFKIKYGFYTLDITFSNNVPYINLLDTGYSSQNRTGILIPAIKKALRNLPQIWKKEVNSAFW